LHFYDDYADSLEIWECEPPGEPKSSLTIRRSLFAIRYPLPSRPADLPISQPADKFGSAGTSPSQNFRRLKSALSFFVINYGLKSVAWFVFGCVTNYGLKSVAWGIFLTFGTHYPNPAIRTQR